jgi:hypothetical protein
MAPNAGTWIIFMQTPMTVKDSMKSNDYLCHIFLILLVARSFPIHYIIQFRNARTELAGRQ